MFLKVDGSHNSNCFSISYFTSSWKNLHKLGKRNVLNNGPSQVFTCISDNPSATVIVEHFKVLTIPIKFMLTALRLWLKRERERQRHRRKGCKVKEEKTWETTWWPWRSLYSRLALKGTWLGPKRLANQGIFWRIGLQDSSGSSDKFRLPELVQLKFAWTPKAQAITKHWGYQPLHLHELNQIRQVHCAKSSQSSGTFRQVFAEENRSKKLKQGPIHQSVKLLTSQVTN